MFLQVEEHVHDRIANLARRLHVDGVIAFAPHLPSSADGAIDGTTSPYCETSRAPTQSALVVGLDDEVHVISLDGEVNDAKSSTTADAIGIADCVAHPREKELRTERGTHGTACAQREMHRMRGFVLRPGRVRDRLSPFGATRPARAFAVPTPCVREPELFLDETGSFR